jgi:hypothetical protein
MVELERNMKKDQVHHELESRHARDELADRGLLSTKTILRFIIQISTLEILLLPMFLSWSTT